jgi:hypothetical protein
MSARLSGQGRKRFAQHQQPDSQVLPAPSLRIEQSRMPMRVTYPVGESVCHCSAFDRTVAAQRENKRSRTCRRSERISERLET